MKTSIIFCLVFLSSWVNGLHTKADDSFSKKAIFIPQWSHQAQFAGYYVAYEKGIYKAYGIDLAIMSGGPDSPSTEYLKNGKADFATMFLSTAIRERADEVNLVNIAQIIQRSALMLVAKKSSKINDPKEMDGKKIGLWGPEFQVQARALFKKYEVEPKIIPQSQSINLFLRDGVDVASAMWYNEYHTILNNGIDPEELRTFFFDDYGLNFPEDGIYTSKENFEKDPSLSCAFVKASIEGWKYAFENPDEAIDIVLKYMRNSKLPANRVHQKWMLERMKDIILADGELTTIGVLKEEDYNRVTDQLKKTGLIKDPPELREFYKVCN
ncbi:MAG TPA: ABC transporter substrate-binding protein [Thermodesulfobacteriota bacterium]